MIKLNRSIFQPYSTANGFLFDAGLVKFGLYPVGELTTGSKSTWQNLGAYPKKGQTPFEIST
jgi:hypothetical protein